STIALLFTSFIILSNPSINCFLSIRYLSVLANKKLFGKKYFILLLEICWEYTESKLIFGISLSVKDDLEETINSPLIDVMTLSSILLKSLSFSIVLYSSNAPLIICFVVFLKV